MHSGKYWNFEIPMPPPRPYTKPYPQILRSVASEASLASKAKLGRPVLIAAASATRNIEIYRTAARDAGVSANQIDYAVAESWVARTVVLAPTDQEAIKVGLPYYEQMQTYRAAQGTAFEEMVAKTRASGRLRPLRFARQHAGGLYQSRRDRHGSVFVRFRTGRYRRNSPRAR